MAKAKKKFYAYFVVDGPNGVTDSWGECESAVSGREARYRGFASESMARAWLDAGAKYEDKGHGTRRKLPKNAIYFDAGTGGSGVTRARVTDRDGVPIIHLGEPSEGTIDPEGNLVLRGRTNNYGELYACLMAVRTAMKLGLKRVLGDSKLVIEYWSRGFLGKAGMSDRSVMKIAGIASELREEFENSGGSIEYLPGDENPADLGYHKPSA